MSLARVETARLVLRAWRDEDREPFARMNADPRVMEHFVAPMTRAQTEESVDRIVEHWRVHGFGVWAVEEERAFIGFVGLWRPSFEAHFTPCVEVGWRLAADRWGRGLATEAAKKALAVGFDQLGLEEIVSFTVPGNARSRRVMEKVGLVHDPAGEFDHPRVPEEHPLRRHVLYRATRSAR